MVRDLHWGDKLLRYHDFSTLFGDFNGYVDFFLLQDLVNDGQVQMLHPNTSFENGPRPATVDGLREYWRAAVAFVQARNALLLAYAKSRSWHRSAADSFRQPTHHL